MSRLRHLAGLAVLAAVSAGCASPFAGPPVDPTLAGRRVPEPVATAQTGGVLRVAVGQLSSLDPADLDGTDGAAETAVRLLCDTLIALDPVTGRFQPALLETWRVDNAATAPLVTVQLRRGARYADGSEVTARDVAATLTRIASADADSPAAGLVRSIAGTEFVSGNPPPGVDPPPGADEKLLGITVLQRDQLSIALRPRSSIPGAGNDGVRQLLLAFTDPALSPVPEKALKGAVGRLRTEPNCAGPYRLARPWVASDPVIALERNPGYHGRHGAYTRGGAGWVDRVELHVVSDRAGQLEALRTGRVDVATPLPEQVPEAAGAGRLQLAPTAQVEYLAFPDDDPRFADPQVRRGLSLAIDRAAVAAASYGGTATPGSHLPPPALLVEPVEPCPAAPAAPDPAAARAAIPDPAALGPVTLAFNDEFGHGAAMEAVARSWREVLGLEVTLEALSPAAYVDRLSGAFGLDGQRLAFPGPFRAGWVAVEPSARSLLDAVLGPAGRAGAEASNVARFEDEAFDRRLRSVAEAVEPAEVAAAEASLLAAACETLPVVPLVHRKRPILLAEGVTSAIELAADATTGFPLLRELYLR